MRLAHSSRFDAPHAGTIPSTNCTVSGAFFVHGPSGITWWVCTSTTNSPFPPSACSHASTSWGGGTVNEPPGPDVVVMRDGRRRRGCRRVRRRGAARGEVDRGQHGGDAARAVQELAPVHAGSDRGLVGEHAGRSLRHRDRGGSGGRGRTRRSSRAGLPAAGDIRLRDRSRRAVASRSNPKRRPRGTQVAPARRVTVSRRRARSTGGRRRRPRGRRGDPRSSSGALWRSRRDTPRGGTNGSGSARRTRRPRR